MANSLRDKFANLQPDSRIIEVEGVGKVQVKELTVGDIESVSTSDDAYSRAKNVALALYDPETNKRIFNPENEDDVHVIMQLGTSLYFQIVGAFEEKN